METDSRYFELVFRTLEGKKVVEELKRELFHLDAVSRKLRGERLLENTIRRDTYREIIEKFSQSADPSRTIEERKDWA